MLWPACTKAEVRPLKFALEMMKLRAGVDYVGRQACIKHVVMSDVFTDPTVRKPASISRRVSTRRPLNLRNRTCNYDRPA